MQRNLAIDLDCVLDLIQVAEQAGDAYLTAVLKLAERRLTRWIPG